jgi:microsomal dipeptidase-like Zn-dependent dipeptidase
MLVFDAHLDLAMNAVEWNRDLTRPIDVIREREKGMTDKPDRSKGTVCLSELRRGGVGLCVATQIARVEHNAYSPVFGWRSQAQAWAMTQAQLAWYRAMEEVGEMVQIKDVEGLEKHLKLWLSLRPTPGDSSAPPDSREDKGEGEPPLTWPSATLSPPQEGRGQGEGWPRRFNGTMRAKSPEDSHLEAHPAVQRSEEETPRPVGYILSLEGADSLVRVQHLERAWEYGLRAVGPAHYGPGIYANGTDATGGFNRLGRELLKEMDRLGFILDATHLCDDCFWEALDLFDGHIWASHSNSRTLVPHNRQFSDEQIKALVQRGAVIGGALDAWMLVPGWVRGQTTPEAVGLKLENMVEHLDHVCQVAGSARHSGIGSDLDGAFGREQTPVDLDTIADLARIPDLLRARGYSEEDGALIAHGNFVRFLKEAWS